MSPLVRIDVPRDVLESARLTTDDARIELAVHLYALGRLGFGKSRQLSGLPQWQFRQLLASRNVAVQYDTGDLEQDLATLGTLPQSMIVVSDTSPLIYLAALRRFEILRILFSEIHIPEAVWEELNAGGQEWPGAAEVGGATWIHRHVPENRTVVQALLRELDRGEAEGIALAVELHADLVLIDERDGRRVAEGMGLPVAGLVAVLVKARNAGLIDCLRDDLEELRRAGFRLADAVVERALRAAGEM